MSLREDEVGLAELVPAKRKPSIPEGRAPQGPDSTLRKGFRMGLPELVPPVVCRSETGVIRRAEFHEALIDPAGDLGLPVGKPALRGDFILCWLRDLLLN